MVPGKFSGVLEQSKIEW